MSLDWEEFYLNDSLSFEKLKSWEKSGESLIDSLSNIKKFNLLLNEEINILDIGCASGYNSLLFANTFVNSNVVGIDISQEAISIAKKNIKHNNLEFYNLDMLDINNEFNKNQFDIIFNLKASIFLDVNKRKDFFHKLLNILKPKGYYIFEYLDKINDKNKLEDVKCIFINDFKILKIEKIQESTYLIMQKK